MSNISPDINTDDLIATAVARAASGPEHPAPDESTQSSKITESTNSSKPTKTKTRSIARLATNTRTITIDGRSSDEDDDTPIAERLVLQEQTKKAMAAATAKTKKASDKTAKTKKKADSSSSTTQPQHQLHRPGIESPTSSLADTSYAITNQQSRQHPTMNAATPRSRAGSARCPSRWSP